MTHALLFTVYNIKVCATAQLPRTPGQMRRFSEHRQDFRKRIFVSSLTSNAPYFRQASTNKAALSKYLILLNEKKKRIIC